MNVRANTRNAALVRSAMTTLIATAALFTSIAALGAGNPVGIVLVIPPLYLLWVWTVDVTMLVQHRFQSTGSYASRPYYLVWMLGCALPVAAWSAWLSLR